ncbi:uncharacterized protein BX664DRAFT_281650 [Halteromyces radiatus]|uniref:uncharacterized protein n=1 Tax=Halteromyces radiatus TaxID=101107 RepID=UPI00221F2C0A|nr:uncharacterized protein BX664DRAFT_281650 [Halteromyces radiatus]KAI8086052.1 hypothetical protein BX664DRAFT_281650 [Halteromyces radiatus]
MRLKYSSSTILQLLLLQLLLYSNLLSYVVADEHNHKYQDHDEVVAWMNTVGSIYNRQETYPYFKLPFCRGTSQVEHRHETLGEALQGMDLVNSGISIRYLQPIEHQVICKTTLNPQDIETFKQAISQQYWFTMFIDDLPINAPIGISNLDQDGTDVTYPLHLHKAFTVEYNDDRIISVSLDQQEPMNLNELSTPELSFTYSVTWKPTSILFQDRFDRLLETKFFEHKVHWLSICSSFMMVLFLTGMVSIILLRTVKRDFSRYDREEEGLDDFERDLGDEGYGWKQVHGDVFRQPPHLMLMSAFIGSGSQLVVMGLVMIMYIIKSQSYSERASIMSASIALYTLTAVVSGYSSTKFYATYGGKDWVRNVILTAIIIPVAAGCVGGYINTLAIYYSSSRAVPFMALFSVIVLWFLVVFPLTILGAIIARRWGGYNGSVAGEFPCRINPIPRPIPEKLWYQEPLAIAALGGILPFGSIFIEMYFIFTSFWTYKIYYVYGFMLLIFVILLVVSSCVAIVSTYFLLNSEDHRWHWVSFMSCASTSLYIYLYATYYYFTKTKMTGAFQTSFYFGYTGLLCLGMFCMLGFVGHSAGHWFVKKIYQNVKID